jgi:hypothetical protein
VPYSCATAIGSTAVTSDIGLTVPDSVKPGGTVAAGAIQVNPGAFNPIITTPVALTTTVQDTLTVTVTSSGGGSATFDIVGAASAQQTVPAGGSPANGPFANTNAITIPATLAPGTLTWKAGQTLLTAATTAYGNQVTTCTIDASKTNPNLVSSTISNASGSVASPYVRPGGSVAFSGSGWIAGETVTPSFKDSAGTVTTGTAITVPAGGAISGSVTVPAAAATGAGTLQLTGSGSGLIPVGVTVQGGPTLTAAPGSGGPGTAVTLSGDNWDPGAGVAVSGVDASSNPVGSPVVLTADANGHLAGTYTVPATAIVGIGAAELVGGVPSTTLRSFAAFSFANGSCTADAAGSVVPSTGTCSIPQNAGTVVTGGPLQMKENSGAVTFPGVTLDGTAHTTAGALQQIDVQDFRGSDQGWTLNATASDLAITAGPYVGGAAIPAAALSAGSLHCAGNPAAGPYPSTPAAGSGGVMSTTTAITLCSQTGNTTPAVTGGDFLVDGTLTLAVPAYVLQGTYSGTVTLSLQ